MLVPMPCPHCHQEVNAPSNDPRPVRCPHCQGIFQTAPVSPATATPKKKSKKPASPANDFEGFDEDDNSRDDHRSSRRSSRPRWESIPPEPWYYTFLFCVVVAGLVIGIGGTAYITHLRFAAIERQAGLVSDAAMSSEKALAVGTLLIVSLVLLFWAAVGFLLLDMARNIRITRYNTR